MKISKMGIQLITYAILLLLLFTLFMQSDLLLLQNPYMHMDSQVYIHTAKQLVNGKILYRDIFDHKGPTLYLFECAGILLSPNTFKGIWLVQFIVLLSGFSFLLWLESKRTHIAICLASALIFVSFIFRSMTIGDNLPEVYAIGIIAFIYFLVRKKDLSTHYSNSNFILFGVATTILFFLKINFIILILPCMIYMMCIGCTKKEILRNVLYVSIGFLIVFLPFLFYFMYHHALSDAYESIWLFNVQYIKNNPLSPLQSIYDVLSQKRHYYILLVIVLIPLKLFFIKKDRREGILLFCTLLLSLWVLVALPGRGNDSIHYLLPFAPLFFWIPIWLCKHTSILIQYVFIIFSLVYTKPQLTYLASPEQKISKPNAIAEYINQYKLNDETLAVFGNFSSLYWNTAMECNTRFFYTHPILHDCDSKLMKIYLEEFTKNKANWIVQEKEYKLNTCLATLLSEYTLVYENNQAKVYSLIPN